MLLRTFSLKKGVRDPTLKVFSIEVLHDQEARKLEKPFLEEEVFAAL